MREILHVEAPSDEACPLELPGPSTSTGDPWIVGDIQRWLSEDPPPMKWIVEGLIPAGVPGVFAARANVGKSLTALLIGLSLASGRGCSAAP